MTRIIGLLNFKGGTGKTTTVVNLGMALALRGRRVLAIDLDPQGSVGKWLGVSHENTLAEALLGTTEWPNCVARARVRFDIIPADRRLAETEQILIEQQAPPDVLAHSLAGVDLAGYDYVLLDCAPSINLMSECALYFAREVFIPVSTEYLALVGAREVIIEILRARRSAGGHGARVSLVIPSFFYARHKKSRDTLKVLHTHFPNIVSSPIRSTVRLSEAPSHQQTIFEYDPHGPGSQDFAQLAERVMNDE